MPFTFSHPAAVVPLAYLPKKWISISALVIGSITPDFEYFIRMKHIKTISHTIYGVFWFDLPLALIILFVFNVLVRDALVDHLPVFLNRRFSSFKSDNGKKSIQKNFVVILISLFVGIASHLIWDKVTHKTGDIIEVHWEEFYMMFWDLYSLIGAAIIAFSIYKLPKGKITQKTGLANYWVLLVIIAIIVTLLYTPRAYHYRDLVVPFISGLIIGLIITSLVQRIKAVKAPV